MPKKTVKKAVKRSVKKTAKRVMELKVERMKLSKLKAHPKNPRKHPKKGTDEWDVLVSSLEHDYFDPIVYNARNGMLVSGHLRKKVMASMGVSEADVVVVDYDDKTHMARMIAANKLIGEDNQAGLREIFGELSGTVGFDLGLTGFTLPEIEGLAPTTDSESETESDDDRATFSKGDLRKITEFFGKGAIPIFECHNHQTWKVGRHYLYIGSVMKDYDSYMPLLDQLKEEHPTAQVLFVPMPDPLMLGSTDPKAVSLFIQPSSTAASLAMSLLKSVYPKTKIELA